MNDSYDCRSIISPPSATVGATLTLTTPPGSLTVDLSSRARLLRPPSFAAVAQLVQLLLACPSILRAATLTAMPHRPTGKRAARGHPVRHCW